MRVHRYPDGRLAVFHGPRRLADYEPDGSLVADPPRRRGRPARPSGQGSLSAAGGVLWICGRVLRTGASPAGRVDKTVDNAGALPTALPTLSRLSPTSSPGTTTTDPGKTDNPCATKPDSSICCQHATCRSLLLLATPASRVRANREWTNVVSGLVGHMLTANRRFSPPLQPARTVPPRRPMA